MNLSKNDVNKTTNLIQDKIMKNSKNNVFLEDFLEAKEVSLYELSENTLLSLITFNSYHNPMFTNVTYVLNENGNLYRVESLDKITKENINNVNPALIYIDLIYKNVKSFFVEESKENSYLIYIAYKERDEDVISIPFISNF